MSKKKKKIMLTEIAKGFSRKADTRLLCSTAYITHFMPESDILSIIFHIKSEANDSSHLHRNQRPTQFPSARGDFKHFSTHCLVLL